MKEIERDIWQMSNKNSTPPFSFFLFWWNVTHKFGPFAREIVILTVNGRQWLGNQHGWQWNIWYFWLFNTFAPS